MEKEDISVTTVEEGATSKMFELGAGLYRKGELKGELKGERRKNLDFAKKLMRQSGYSQDDAVKYLELPEDEEKNLLEDLEAEKKRQQEVIQ